MQDILLNDTGDITVVNGDLKIGDATLQHQNLILKAQKGEFKEWPELGVGILTELLNENPRELLQQIRKNFEYDGMKVTTLKFANNGNVLIDAAYN